MRIRFPEMARAISLWQSAEPPPDVLVLGSSRFESFVHQEELAALTEQMTGQKKPGVFRGTIPGGEPITLEFEVRHLLALRETAPRLVLIETNLDLLARDNLYFKGIITRQLTAPDFLRYGWDILRFHDATPRLLSSRLTPFFRHRYHFLKWARDSLPAPTEAKEKEATMVAQPHGPPTSEGDGMDPPKLKGTPEERMRIALRRFQIHLRHYELAGATSETFERMVAQLHERGCRVVLVQPPLLSTHRALYGEEMRAQFRNFVQHLHRSYGCEFFDYIDKMPDNFFVDNHHGSGEGGSRFTEFLVRDVVAPAWQNLHANRGQ